MHPTQNSEIILVPQDMIIRPIEGRDNAVWRDMWLAYCTFYEVSLPEVVTQATWKRILDPASSIKALIATTVDGKALGFANYILHASTWSEKQSCLLDDLFVRPETRKRGVGRALINHLIQLAHASDWGQLYWMTRENNVTARRLYDQFTQSDGFVRYALPFEED